MYVSLCSQTNKKLLQMNGDICFRSHINLKLTFSINRGLPPYQDKS